MHSELQLQMNEMARPNTMLVDAGGKNIFLKYPFFDSVTLDILELSEQIGLSFRTAQLSLIYLKLLVVKQKQCTQDELKICAFVCIWLASKFEGDHLPEMYQEKIGLEECLKENLFKLEQFLIVHILNWKVHFNTPADYIFAIVEWLEKAGKVGEKEKNYFLESALKSSQLILLSLKIWEEKSILSIALASLLFSAKVHDLPEVACLSSEVTSSEIEVNTLLAFLTEELLGEIIKEDPFVLLTPQTTDMECSKFGLIQDSASCSSCRLVPTASELEDNKPCFEEDHAEKIQQISDEKIENRSFLRELGENREDQCELDCHEEFNFKIAGKRKAPCCESFLNYAASPAFP